MYGHPDLERTGWRESEMVDLIPIERLRRRREPEGAMDFVTYGSMVAWLKEQDPARVFEMDSCSRCILAAYALDTGAATNPQASWRYCTVQDLLTGKLVLAVEDQLRSLIDKGVGELGDGANATTWLQYLEDALVGDEGEDDG